MSPQSSSFTRPHRPSFLLSVLLVAALSGCIGAEPPTGPPPQPQPAQGPEPDTIFTDSQGRALSPAEVFFLKQLGERPPLGGMQLNVSSMTYTDVALPAEFAARGLAEGLEFERVGWDNGRNGLVRGFVFGFRSVDGVLDRNDPLVPSGNALGATTSFWTAVVVRPVESLRNADAAIHLVLLDAYATEASLSAVWDEWSPATHTETQRVELNQIRSAAAISTTVEASSMFRFTTEVAFPVQEAPERIIRVLGVQDNAVVAFVDITMFEHLSHAGHGVAFKGDPYGLTFPPVAGYARLDVPAPGHLVFQMRAQAQRVLPSEAQASA